MSFSEEEYQKLNIEVEKGTRGGNTYWVDGFPYCLRKKKGVYCANKAGKATDHVGKGACKFHGGNSGRPPTHGRKALVAQKELASKFDQMMSDPKLFDVLPHVALQKHLLQDALKKYEENPNEDNLHLVRMLNNDSIVGQEKLSKIGSQYSVTQMELRAVLTRSVTIFKTFIRRWFPNDDEFDDKFEEFLTEWKDTLEEEFAI